LQYLEANPELPSDGGELGPPLSALINPCQRCWIYPRSTTKANARYCSTCQTILNEARRLGTASHYAVAIWGFVNKLPRQLRIGGQSSSSGSGPRGTLWEKSSDYVLGTYIHDENHFLVMLYHLGLKRWFQELAIYHGADLKGFLQVFPTLGAGDPSMGDLLVRLIHHEARFPLDRLRVRYFSSIRQVFDPRPYEREGVLTFEIADFLNMLEMVAVFRSILRPDEQKILYKLLTMGNTSEAQFYWGRFLGSLSQEAKDMLEAWRIRQWSQPQVDLLYELSEHVAFYQSR